MGKLLRQIGVDHVIQAMFRQGLLFGADSHLEHMLDRVNPFAIVLDERIVFDGVPRPLDVHILQRMRRQLVVDDILRRDSEKPGLGDAEKFIQMRGISGSDFQCPIDIRDPVRISVHKDIDRDFFEIRQTGG